MVREAINMNLINSLIESSARSLSQTPSPRGEGGGEGKAAEQEAPFENFYSTVDSLPLNLAFSLRRRDMRQVPCGGTR